MRFKQVIQSKKPPYNTYMVRYGFQTKWFGIWVHHVLTEADQLWHTHFNSFWSLLLWGRYTELRKDENGKTQGKVYSYTPGKINRIKYNIPHIVSSSRPFWTLCISGAYRHEWYFVRRNRRIPWYRLMKDYR